MEQHGHTPALPKALALFSFRPPGKAKLDYPAPWDKPYKNSKPLIGILAQVGADGASQPEVANLRPACPANSHFVLQACHYCPGRSYVAAGFVKWIEAAGARAVPIRCDPRDACRRESSARLGLPTTSESPLQVL